MIGCEVLHHPPPGGSSINSVGSSSSDSSRGTCRNRTRFRTVHLKRPPGSYTFGFSFRGGREFGTGFFVSVVEPGSEAHHKGVKVGDQILRINGLSVDNATHHEVLQLAQHHHHLTLSLKNVGLIPVKDSCEDPLTWRLVDQQPLDPTLFAGGCDVDRVIIDAPEGAKLGCGICKGPDWRPGIFVQYTKPGSLARLHGLQPGDQILQCNRVSFNNIDFSYAVSVLKAHGALDLIVRKGSGIDLFPGESSGYSSASSTADEGGSHTQTLRRSNGCNGEENKASVVGKREKGRPPPPPPPPCVPIPPPFEQRNSIQPITTLSRSKSTDYLNEPSSPLVTFRKECRYGSQTVVQITNSGGDSPVKVEVHQRSSAPAPPTPPSLENLEKRSSISSFSSSNSLSSAISQEFIKRQQRKAEEGDRMTERPQKKPTVEGQTKEHDQLIAELKRRQDHRMAAAAAAATTALPTVSSQNTTMDELSPPDSLDEPPPCPSPDYSDSSAEQSPLPSHNVKTSILRFEERTKKPQPKTVTFGASSTKEITPTKTPSKPIIPHPSSVVENVEMNSLEPTELVQPKQLTPKPPSTYFKPPTRKDLSESPKRTTVIKITEYPSENLKKPAKSNFINGGSYDDFNNELANTLSKVKSENGDLKLEGKINGKCAQNIVPVFNVGQNELCSAKKTLKTFEKNRGGNTIIVQIPNRG